MSKMIQLLDVNARIRIRKVFSQQKCSIPSEPVRTTLGWAPRGADSETGRVQGQDQPLPGNDSDHSGKPNAGKEDEGREAESQVRCKDEAGSRELVQERKDGSETLLRLFRPPAVGFMGSQHNLNTQGLGN